MPPVNPSQQGSRAGLITALVIFVILFVTSTVISFQCYNAWKGANDRAIADKKALEPAVTPSVMDTPDVADACKQGKLHGMTGIEWAISQRNSLAKLVTNNGSASVKDVQADTARTVKSVEDEVTAAGAPVTLDKENVLVNLKALAGQITTLTAALQKAQTDAKTANDAAAAKVKELADALAAKDKDIDAAKKEAEEAKGANDTRQKAVTDNVAAIQKDADAKIAAAAAATANVGAELGKIQQELKKAIDQFDKLKAVLAKYRLNPARSLLQPAGVITRVPGNNTVFINLGLGQQITPGLTFEIYDRKKGLPSLTAANTTSADPDELPVGKASIEVIRILDSTSECRVVHLAQGQQIVEGDLALNLIYNTHTRFAFTVYGDFDLANSGQATPSDAEVIRRLVSQWGGRVMDQVTVDTDFLVLGKQPVVNPLPDNPTPLDQERFTKQNAALDKYLKMESDASHLSVPVLNQNRFLYFTGYYDQAKR